MEIITDPKFRKTMKILRALLFISSIVLAIILFLYITLLIYAKILGPPPLAVPQSSLYYADDGTVIGESHSGQKRYWVPLEEIAPALIDATISIEDQSFFQHHGFDYKRIAGAALADMKAMAKVQGASTISQQYARNLFLDHDKTWKRKILEAFYTIRIEMNYTKNEILEGYLNTIYYGEGAYGVEAASQFYFGKKAKDLNLAEAAMLAGIPKGPSIYSPVVSFEKAKQRQELILAEMEKDGLITKEEREEASKAELNITAEHQNKSKAIAPYFQDAVNNALKNVLNISDQTIALGGLKIYTTLNVEQQKIAEEQIQTVVGDETEIQAALVAIDPHTGHVKAMVGGKNYDESPFNRAVQAVRQPGSTFKPFLYYAAIESGFTPVSKMRSELTTFRFDDGRKEYTPHNYNNLYANDEITMMEALALSDNVYAVKTHLFIGENALIETAKKLGISTELKKVPSLALGTSGVRVIEMANAYSHFANGGKKVSPVFITKVENYNGDVIYEYKAEEDEYVLEPESAFVTAHLMTGMFDRSLNSYTTVTGHSIVDKMTRTYAGKSGSTNTDNWMIGFSPQLVTAVWTGYDEGRKIELVREKSYAKNIWINFMEKALKEEAKTEFEPPKGVVGVPIDPENGLLATEDCPVSRLTYFVEGTEPTEYCFDHIFDKTEEEQPPKQKKEKEKLPWYKKIWKWAA